MAEKKIKEMVKAYAKAMRKAGFTGIEKLECGTVYGFRTDRATTHEMLCISIRYDGESIYELHYIGGPWEYSDDKEEVILDKISFKEGFDFIYKLRK